MLLCVRLFILRNTSTDVANFREIEKRVSPFRTTYVLFTDDTSVFFATFVFEVLEVFFVGEEDSGRDGAGVSASIVFFSPIDSFVRIDAMNSGMFA